MMTCADQKQDAPLVSVIVPVYNEADTIVEILGRIRNASFRKEIITGS